MATWVRPRHCEEDRIRSIEPHFRGRLLRAVDIVIDWADLSRMRLLRYLKEASLRGSSSGSSESKWTRLNNSTKNRVVLSCYKTSHISPCSVYKLESLPTITWLSCLFQLVFFFCILYWSSFVSCWMNEFLCRMWIGKGDLYRICGLRYGIRSLT